MYELLEGTNMTQITYNKDIEMMEAKCRYDKEFVEALKKYIPTNSRKWDADKKVWYVDFQYRILFEKIVLKYLKEKVTYVGDFPKEHHFINSNDNVYYHILQLRPDCCDEMVIMAFKTLQKKYHPDMPNGDKIKSQRINLAYEELKKLRGF